MLLTLSAIHEALLMLHVLLSCLLYAKESMQLDRRASRRDLHPHAPENKTKQTLLDTEELQIPESVSKSYFRSPHLYHVVFHLGSTVMSNI